MKVYKEYKSSNIHELIKVLSNNKKLIELIKKNFIYIKQYTCDLTH